MRKSGFTLMELMVYIAILGVVVIIAGQAFSNSTKIRVRTESMVKANEEAERVGSLLQEDVAQMGAKSAKEDGSGMASDQFFVAQNVYMDAANGDSSSFRVREDSLVMRRMRYDAQGRYLAVEEVTWYKAGNSLYRKCQTLDYEKTRVSLPIESCPTSNSTGVQIASNVEFFRAIPAKPSVLASEYTGATAGNYPRLLPSSVNMTDHAFRLFPRVEGTGEQAFLSLERDPKNGGSSVKLSNFASNFDDARDEIKTSSKKANQVFVVGGTGTLPETSAWQNVCTKVTLKANVEYEISFVIPYDETSKIRSFAPEMDHMSIGFRNAKTGAAVNGLPDFPFYPPIDGSAQAKRKIRFSVKEDLPDMCMAFTFAMYSPNASLGKLTISNLELKKVETSDFVFEDSYSPDEADKANVKAFKLVLVISRNGESGNVSLVVPTPSNGAKK